MTIEHFWGIAGFGFHVSAREASRYAIAPKQRDLVQKSSSLSSLRTVSNLKSWLITKRRSQR
jgi:hypothetical protein